MITQRTITSIFEDVRRSESLESKEFIARLFLVILAASAGWLLLGLDLLPIWVATYYSVVVLEKRLLQTRNFDHPTLMFWSIWGAGFLLASVFCFLPVYFWYMGSDVWKFGALVLYAGGVLNVFLLRSRRWQIGIAYIIPFCVAGFAMAADLYVAPGGGPAFWAASILSCCLVVYFAVALWESHRLNKELAITRSQLIQAQKVEALGTLTSGVAHDFNNLLSVVQGNLELLKAYPHSGERDEYLSEALAATKRGASLTRQLTSYARKAELVPEKLFVSDVLNDLEAIVARVLPAYVNFEMSDVNPEAQVFADSALLQSALLNLIINARDAMEQGGRLQLRFLPDHPMAPPGKAGRFHVFEVEDTGHGIPETIRDKIFDPFFSTKARGKGSGLGLPMVAGFAQQSGGDLIVRSSSSKGTIMQLFLPRAISAKETSNEEPPRLQAGA